MYAKPSHLPSGYSLTHKVVRLFVQVYAPLEEEAAHEEVFHRALFVFVTPQVRPSLGFVTFDERIAT